MPCSLPDNRYQNSGPGLFRDRRVAISHRFPKSEWPAERLVYLAPRCWWEKGKTLLISIFQHRIVFSEGRLDQLAGRLSPSVRNSFFICFADGNLRGGGSEVNRGGAVSDKKNSNHDQQHSGYPYADFRIKRDLRFLFFHCQAELKFWFEPR